jgi:phosphoribosylglycinamide formyltransferase-1
VTAAGGAAAPGGGLRVGVLASRAGTNLQALLDGVHGRDGIEVVAVASNEPEAPALRRARDAGVETQVFPLADHPDRTARDALMAEWLEGRGVGLVVLAGYMQLLSPAFLARFPEAVINVHPALLPSFPGLQAIEQALDYGVRVTGVTVHFVDEGVDSGPVILQRAVEIAAGATAGDLRELLRPIEHELLPKAVRLIASGAVSVDPEQPRRVVIA